MYTIIKSHFSFDGSHSTIEDFASFFHQDFDLMEESPDEFAHILFKSLSDEQKKELRESFLKLLEEYPGKKQGGLVKAWYRLGAHWWDRKYDLRSIIQNWINFLEKDCT